MNIFFRELRANWRSLLGWCAFIVFFTYMGIAKFAAFYQDPAAPAILDNIPKQVMQALSMEAFNMTTLEGFFGIMFNYFALMAGIFGVLLGSEMLAKEERDKTAEFALVLPISRARLVTAKLAAGVVQCAIVVLVMWGASLLFAGPYDPSPEFQAFVGRMSIAYFLLALVFFALGLLLASVIKNFRRSSGVAMSVLMAAFFISLFSEWDERLHVLQYITPFKYFDPLTMLNETRFEWPLIALNVGITVACVVVAYMAYQRRDLYI